MGQKLIDVLLPHFYHWGYYILLVMTFLETSAFFGFLVPGESIVVTAGLLAARGILELGDVIWVASLGAILGDTVGYFIGHRFGERFFLRYGKYFFFKREYLDEAKGLFDRSGGKVVFFGRFLAWLRAFAPVVAGISGMPYPRFLLFNILGGIAWAATFSLIGYLVGNSWEIIRIYLSRIGLFALMNGIIVLYLYFLFTTKKQLIQEKVGWIDRTFSSQMPKSWSFVKGRFRAGEWYGFNLTIALIFLLLALLSFGEIVEDLIDKETLYDLDFRIQELLEQIISPQITRWMVGITNLGSVYATIITVIVVSIYFLHRRNWWDLFTLFLVVGVGEMFLWLLKLLFHRARPASQLITAPGYSFPSGHAFAATIVYGFLFYLTWKWIDLKALRFIIFVVLIFLILVIGMSRIYLGVHWLTDVLGGYAAGFAWLVLSIGTVNTVKQITEQR